MKTFLLLLMGLLDVGFANAQIKFTKEILNVTYGYTGLCETNDHNLAGIRTLQLNPHTTYQQIGIEKLNRRGGIIWQKGFQITGVTSSITSGQLKQLADGTFFGTAIFLTRRYCLFKLDSAGNLLWQKCYLDSIAAMGSASPSFYATALNDGSFILVTQKIIAKVDANGNTVAVKELMHDAGWTHVISAVSDANTGGFFIAGTSSHVQGTYVNDLSLFRFDNDLNIVWQKIYSSPADLGERQIDLICDGDGGVSGLAYNSTSISIIKFDGNGIKLWDRQYTHPQGGYFHFNTSYVQQDNILSHVGKNYLISGSVQKSGPTFDEPLILLLDSAGNQLQMRFLGNYSGDYDYSISAAAMSDYTVFSCFQAVKPTYVTNSYFLTRLDSLTFSGGCNSGVPNLTVTTNSLTFSNGAHPTDTFYTVSSVNLPVLNYTTSSSTPYISYECSCNNYFKAKFITNRDSICAGDSLVFANLTTADSFLWKINNIVYSSSYNFGYRFSQSGSYNIKLVAFDAGCQDSLTKVIHVYQPVLQSTANTVNCPQLATGTIALTCTGGAGPYTYHWQQNISDSAKAVNLTAGLYCATVTDILACMASICDSVSATNQSAYSQISASICNGSNYNFDGRILNAAGVYRDTLASANGCDSIITLTLIDSCAANCSALYTLYPNPLISHNWYALSQVSGRLPINYLWNWGDGSSDTGTTPSHTYSTEAYYNICLQITDSTGCTSTYCDSSTYIYKTDDLLITINCVLQLPTAATEIEQDEPIGIYPIPAKDRLHILHGKTAITRLRILNLQGSVLTELNMPEKNEIDISNLPDGVYLLQIESALTTKIYKLIKLK